MQKPITATELRSNVYRILDEILETGITRVVTRGGSKVLIVPATSRVRSLEDRPKREGLNGSIDELVSTPWEREWNPGS